MKEQYKRPKHPLNILTYGYFGGIKNLKHNIRQFFRNLKGAYQRVVWGYAASDTWGLDSYFLELFYQSMTYFVQNLHGYPVGFGNEEAWVKYLNKMIAHFYNAQEWHEDTWPSIKENEAYESFWKVYTSKDCTEEDIEEARRKYAEANLEACNFRLQEMKYGIDMLEQVFFDLWD